MRNAFRSTLAMAWCAALLCASTAVAQDWPQWRGPNRDNKVAGFAEPKTWPKDLTKKWTVAVGVGESSPTLVGKKIYVFARQGGNEVTTCLDAESGKELWQDKYEAVAVGGAASRHPGTRSTLAVGEGKVCTLGVGGVVSCLDAATGKLAWRKDTKLKMQFYTSTSPIVAEGKCVVFADGLTAYDLASGEVKWKWTDSEAPYGSPVLVTIDDVKQVISPSGKALVGVGLADGKLLWQVDLASKDYQNNFSTPVCDGRMVFYSMSKGGTMMALKIEKKDDGFKATEVWKKKMAAHQYHTPVFKDGMLIGASLAGRTFFCLDAKTGETLWTDKTKLGECGCILDAGPVLFALSSDKDLIVFKASNKAYTEVAKYQVAEAAPWSVPIIAGNRIYVKDAGGSLTLWTID